MTAVEVRPAHESDVETMVAIYLTAARQGWAHIFGERNLENYFSRPLIGSVANRVDRPAPASVRREQGRACGRLRDCPAVARRGRRQRPSGRARPVLLRSTGLGPGDRPSAHGATGDRGPSPVGFAEATLWTSVDNHRPRRIYEVAGLDTDGTTRDKPWRGASWRELRYRIRL